MLHLRPEDNGLTAEDWQAIADWVIAAGVLTGLVGWLWRQRGVVGGWFTARWRRMIASILSSEVVAGEAWESVSQTPEVSMEAGIAYARTAARSGHPPYTVTQGRVSPEQALDYLLAKAAETVWEAVTSVNSELEPYLVPMRNYLAALSTRASLGSARDFALGVLTERVRQEEDGWPDEPGDRAGKRGPHGTPIHLCLLERKHLVEVAIYNV